MKRLVPVLLLAACSGSPPPTAETGTSSAVSSSTTSSSTSASNTTRDGSTSSTTASDDASSGSGHCGFVGCEDVGDSSLECSLWTQDCPTGEKCAPWANDGGASWNGTRCVATAANPDQPGETCTTDGAVASGLDSCDIGSMCADIDATTGTGRCVPHCTGTENAPICADPMRRCYIPGRGVLPLCRASCDPLESGSCPTDEACYPIDNRFVCAPDDSGEDGATWDACEFINDCDGGLVCVNPTLSDTCSPGAGGCCLPWCDLGAPDCPGDLVCMAWFEEGEVPVGSEFVGLCVEEAALP